MKTQLFQCGESVLPQNNSKCYSSSGSLLKCPCQASDNIKNFLWTFAFQDESAQIIDSGQKLNYAKHITFAPSSVLLIYKVL